MHKSFPDKGNFGSRDPQLLSLSRNQRSMAEQSATREISKSKQNKHAAGTSLARRFADKWGCS
jgi:hypothetical protein